MSLIMFFCLNSTLCYSVEKQFEVHLCLRAVLLARSDDCITLPVWKGLNKVICDYLDNITLQDILDNSAEMIANDYVI